MSDNLTQRFDGPDNNDKLTQILTIVQSLDTRVESLDTRVQSLDTRVQSLDTRVQSLDTRVQSLDTRVENLDTRLGNLEEKVERRLYDTRPIWEKVQTDIGQLQLNVNHLQSDVDELKLGQEFLRRESHEIHTLLRDIFRRLSIFNDTLVTMQADYRDIYDRVREIERQRT